MKTIGLIGGMSWESSVEYYRIINELVQQRLGKPHSAKCVMYSVDFAEIELLQRQGDWEQATQAMISAARCVEAGGADFLLICTNTMHKMAQEVQDSLSIPLLHIADATARAVKAQGIRTVGLLGTRFTMEGDFYKGRLEENHALRVLIPGPAERELVHRVIYDELVVGEIRPASRDRYRQVIAGLVEAGAEGIVLGCTEIGLLVKPEDSPRPLFDTTQIHAEAAVDFAI
ncbi:MAG: aspartate/glutamate racemase family protein [Omnitrophica WOR_2 bacterium]